MSKRSERREAERQTRKSAYIALRQQRAQSAAILDHTAVAAEPESSLLTPEAAAPALETPPTPTEPTKTISEAQLTANRANSQRSTGPNTEEGKAISAKNALTHGLTSKTTVLPTEDPIAYQRELDSFLETYNPATREELLQVETVVDSLWRLARLRRIETGILRKGCLEFQEKTKDQTQFSPEAQRPPLRAAKEETDSLALSAERLTPRPSCAYSFEVEAYLKYEKSIRNLHIQEARLQRQIQKAQAELARLQTIRRREEAAAAKAAKQPQTSAAPSNGFDFSTPGTHHKPTTPNPGNPPPGRR